MEFDDFRKMNVWQTAFNSLIKIYKISSEFPKSEIYGLVSDIRRAGNSIVHNIFEGYGRFEARDKTRFYKISRGSAYEVMSQLLVAKELKLYKEELNQIFDSVFESLQKILKELIAIIKTLETKKY